MLNTRASFKGEQKSCKECAAQAIFSYKYHSTPLYNEKLRHNASQGAGFNLGLAFWPGGTLDDWGAAIDSETVAPGLSPCLLTPYNSTNATDATNITTSHQEYLVNMNAHLFVQKAPICSSETLSIVCLSSIHKIARLMRMNICVLQIQQGVVFATYEAKVDRMTVLRGNATEQASLYALAAQSAGGFNTTSVVAFR